MRTRFAAFALRLEILRTGFAGSLVLALVILNTADLGKSIEDLISIAERFEFS